LFKTGIDGPDGENFGRRRRFHSGSLCVCGIEADKAAVPLPGPTPATTTTLSCDI
jgi:hypothetical protein